MNAAEESILGPYVQEGLTGLAQELLPVIYQHRLMSVRQLHTLVQPHVQHPVYLRRQLRRLAQLGLAAATVRRGSASAKEFLWYVTEAGAEVVETSGEAQRRAFRMSARSAHGLLQEHTVAVNDAGVAMVQHARAAGDECEPLYWHHEVAHRVRDAEQRGGGEAMLVPDAVMSYTRSARDGEGRMLLTWFLEIDRCTEPVPVLASKVAQYARYRHYVPTPSGAKPGRPVAPRSGREAWTERYLAFPRVLMVFTGASPARIRQRILDLRSLLASHPPLTQAAESITAGGTSLEQLQEEGPWGRIFTRLSGPADEVSALLTAPPALRTEVA
ncbi:replication-relaxation family protein [Streptomyces sp. SM12]|uniref:replication-relaxation family protein n=1 Tax=Streptomyces sp. SM12 TaxID=1071602 RepID=UPI000CD534C6|nr:replication-relaxation family protein [Streptomyces sp. SM12]